MVGHHLGGSLIDIAESYDLNSGRIMWLKVAKVHALNMIIIVSSNLYNMFVYIYIKNHQQ